MISSVFDPDIVKVLALFGLQKGARFNRKMIYEKTRLNNIPLDNALNRLVNLKILKKDKNLYGLDFYESEGKKIVGMISDEHKELKEIPLDVYYSIIDLLQLLSKERDISMYLFGSYSKLVYNNGSDIDIALISDNKIKVNTTKIEKKYGKEIEMHYFNNTFYKNKKDSIIADILRNGVKLL